MRRRTTVLTELGAIELDRVRGYFVAGGTIYLNVDDLADRVVVTEPITPQALARLLDNLKRGE